MILRSITKHVREQNWFAVGIDFLIVVVGVYIGIKAGAGMTGRRIVKQTGLVVESSGTIAAMCRHCVTRRAPLYLIAHKADG